MLILNLEHIKLALACPIELVVQSLSPLSSFSPHPIDRRDSLVLYAHLFLPAT